MSVVTVRDVTKAYGRNPPALRDVSLEIGPGVTGLLGPNGAGKSTLIQCVLGLLPDFEGEVEVLGLDARREEKELRRRVGFMPETDAYLPNMTGIQAVRYLGQLTGMPYPHALRRAHEMLYHVGLGEAIYREIKGYSTGMRQRFKLAACLVHDPELIFLDEPLSGMDPQGREELIDLIDNLAHQHGKHIIWSSHILPDVQKVADGVVVLHEGTYRGHFRMEDLTSSEDLWEIEIEGAAEALHASLGTREISFKALRSEESGGRTKWLAQLRRGGRGEEILAAAHESGVRVRSLGLVTEDLEDVFLRILRDSEDTAEGAS
jgi:ABC-2 type transport system ATP-binding protein